uniref:Integrase catalytic domain-containing protein n=1 Tax=Panagrolaimus superbus TaxID=310955 RepID=A0A914Y218_9BILA
MSGKIRKALGPIHGRIKQYIKQYKEVAPEGFDPKNLSEDVKAKTAIAIKRLSKKLTKAVSPSDEAKVENEARKKFYEDYGNIPETLKLAEEVLEDAEQLLMSLGSSSSSSKSTDSERSSIVTGTPTTPTTPPLTAATIPSGNSQPSLPVTTTTTVYHTPVLTTTIASSTVGSTIPINTINPSISNSSTVNATPIPLYSALAAQQMAPPNPPTQSKVPLATTLEPLAQSTTITQPLVPTGTQQCLSPAVCISQTVTPTSYLAPLQPVVTAPPGYVTPSSLKATVANFNNFTPLTQAELALMPHVKLEIFKGDKLKFFSWWQLFFSVIHSKSLDNVIKFQTLINHLSGPAADLLSGYEITSANYFTAINTLLDTYGSSSPSRHSLRTQLFNMTPINGTRRPEDIEKCRNLIKIYRQLVNHGDPCDNEWAGQAVEQKLPRATLSELFREFPEDEPLNAPKILNKLEKIIKHEERVENTYRENRPDEYVRKPFFKPIIRQVGTINTYSPTQPQHPMHTTYNQTKPKRCYLCSGSHFTSECTQYSTPQQRKEAAQKLKACFNCLQKDHSIKDCRSQKTCIICHQRHHTALCMLKWKPGFRDTKFVGRNAQQPSSPSKTPYNGVQQQQKPFAHRSFPGQQPQKGSSYNRTNATTNVASGCIGWEDFSDAYEINEDEVIQTATFTSKGNEDVLKACFKVQVCNPKNPDKTVECIAVLDTCSTHSYCDPLLAKQLHLSCASAPLSVKGIGQSQTRVEAEKCTLGLVDKDRVVPIEAYGWKDFMSQVKRIPLETVDDIETAATLPPPLFDTVSLLIGQDKALSFLLNSQLIALPSGHKLIDIGIGKFVCGQGQLQELKKTVKTFATVLQQLENSHDQNMTEQIDWHHAIESLPFSDNPKDNDAELARTILHDNISIDPETGRIKVPLLFKEGVQNLPSNLGLSTATLFSVWKKYKNEPEILQKIDDIFKEQHKLSILQLVGDLQSEADLESGKHYLPHFPVLTPTKKTTKVRVVVNGSARTKRSKSLNDYLYPGPSTVPDMAAVLLRFRVGKIAISSDIEKAFLQVSLEEKHRDYVRILWLKEFTKPPTRDNIVIYRYARVPFGVNCSPYLLGGSIAYHLSKIGTLIAEEIKQNIYVDNCLVYAENVEEAISKYKEIRQIFGDIKMNIREFVSNSKEFNTFLQQETGEEIPPDTKILGVFWDIREDSLKISLPDPQHDTTNTKRKCLKVLASVPDIFGLLLPIILITKLFFQKLWKSNISWDEKIDNTEWIDATQGWKNFEYSFPRRMISSISSTKELHIFCDASGEAAAAVAYIKEYIEDECHITLIFAKNRIKPLNTEKNGKSTLTIPRMELIGLLIAVRMATFIVNSHISGVLNPADVASRGCTPEQLLTHELWWNGPQLLKLHFTTYPPHISLSNERREKPIFTLIAEASPNIDLFDISKFNSFQKLLGTIYCIFTYITLLKVKTGKTLQYPFTLFQQTRKTALNVMFIEHWLIKLVQHKNPPEEKNSKKFRIKKDEHGIYRCYGRLANSDLSESTKYPIWLPKKVPLTKLIIDHVHQLMHHSGTRTTLAELRQKYWKGISKTVSPTSTSTPTKESWHITIKIDQKAREKRWVALFTCLTTRVLHLEVVENLTTGRFLHALRRFIARRGQPDSIISDNATTFKLAALVENRARQLHLEDPELLDYCAKKGIMWKNIPELSPWFGGMYERLVGLTKTALKRAIGRHIPQQFEFLTYLCEAEAKSSGQ